MIKEPSNTNKLRNNPIGIFDSGVGGLTVLQWLVKILPQESFYYCADSGNCPYGNLSQDDLWNNSCRIMEVLLAQKCKLIVVACNTITTNNIDRLRNKYTIPIIGMEPGTKMAFKLSPGKRIGILATKGTLQGGLFNKTLRTYNDTAFFINQEGVGLVELIEQNKIVSEVMVHQLQKLLKSLIQEGIDTLVLGCTHYNYLSPLIHQLFPYPIQIIDTSEAVANHTKRQLETLDLRTSNATKTLRIATNGSLENLKKILKRLEWNGTAPEIVMLPF